MVAMLRQGGSRKRPAPGTSPLGYNSNEVRNQSLNTSLPNPPLEHFQSGSQPLPSRPLPNNAFFQNSYSDPSATFPNEYSDPYYNTNSNPQSNTAQPSGTELVRAQRNDQVAPFVNDLAVNRQDFGGNQQAVEQQWQGNNQMDDLDHRALLAQKDAQSKRKQIPPFVQKLSSFLDDNTRNTDLIRWSDSGDSFIVIDEDEFARTLIPELFKHNNYASFVRQLNMYGFHKKVGLSDNSMRASERKNKQPSEYSNPYFKRGKPNLLWLIHKPKNSSSKGTGKSNNRAKQEDADEEVDDFFPHDGALPQVHEPIEDMQTGWNGRQPLMLGPSENTLPPEQIKNLKQELFEIRKNQQKITEMLMRTRQENMNLYNQAKAFHDLHEKHDNSINAILTFLATVYNKNLKDGGLDLGNMFGPNSLPQDQGRGNIVDVVDEKEASPVATPYQQPFKKKKPLLLKDKASPVGIPENANQWDPNQWSTGPFPNANKPDNTYLHSPNVQEITTPSARSSQSPPLPPDRTTERNLPQADVLQVLNSTTQNNPNFTGSPMDFTEALAHLQTTDGQSPLTANQRQDMLRLMSHENSPQTSTQNGALTSYSPPNNTAPTLAHFDHNSEQLNQIQQSLKEQEQRMANMQATIAPLSPSGSIPGINNDPSSLTPPNGQQELDLDTIFNSGDYFNDGTDPSQFDFTNGAELPDFDFGGNIELQQNGGGVSGGAGYAAGGDNATGIDGAAGVGLDAGEEARVKELDGSGATSPANTVAGAEEGVEGQGSGYGNEESSPRKVRRRG